MRPTVPGNVGRPAMMSVMTGAARANDVLTMRELGKLTAEQVDKLDHPVPVTSNGLPIAWLVPLTPGERRRASMIATGRLRPRRRPGLADHTSLPAPHNDGPTLSELLREMRAQEHT